MTQTVSQQTSRKPAVFPYLILFFAIVLVPALQFGCAAHQSKESKLDRALSEPKLPSGPPAETPKEPRQGFEQEPAGNNIR